MASDRGPKQILLGVAPQGCDQLVEQLLAADPAGILESTNEEGDTACHLAIYCGHLESAKNLYSYCRPVLYWPNHRRRDTPLHLALSCGYPGFFCDGVRFLCEYFDDDLIRYHHNVEVELADEKVKVKEARLLRDGIVNAQDKSLLYVAAEEGHFEAVELMLTIPPLDDPTGPYATSALHPAVCLGRYDMVQMLLRYKPELVKHQDERTGNNPLHQAVLLEDPVGIVTLLLDADELDTNSTVNTRNYEGVTPFHMSASLGLYEIFKLFLQYSPNCYRTTTWKDQNALHLAVGENALRIAEFIAEDVVLCEMLYEQDCDGNTPLHIAAYQGNNKLIEILWRSRGPLKQFYRNKYGLTFIDALQARKKWEWEKRLVKDMQGFQSGLLVMAVLITTVAFTAAFAVPGGYSSDQPSQGMATLVGKW